MANSTSLTTRKLNGNLASWFREDNTYYLDNVLTSFSESPPPYHLYELDAAYVVHVAAPGLDRESLSVTVEGRTLSIHAKRSTPTVAKSRRLHGRPLTETFSTTIQLPAAPARVRCSAQYVDGILSVTCPKREAEQPRTVPVTFG